MYFGELSALLGALVQCSLRAFAGRILAPLIYILVKMFAPLCGVNICVWRFAPNTGGAAALATINDGASLLIEGELSRQQDS